MPASPRIHADDTAGRRAPIFAEWRATPHATQENARRPHPVTHDYAALALYVEGGVRVRQRDEWRVEAGDVLLVPAGEPHRVVDARPSARWGAGFCVPCLDAGTAETLAAPFERVRDGASPVVRIPGARQAFLESLFRELESIPAARRDAAPVRESLLTLILHEVARAADPAPAIGSPGVVTQALRYIERHCLGPLSLEDVAAAVGRTPSYVTTALTRATGRSAGAWIVAGRMAEARRRLLHADEPVERIATRVGYADATHFIRMFRRTHGATPAAWRTAARAGA